MGSDSDSDSDSECKLELKGPKAPNLVCRIATTALAVASAALMTTACQCRVVLPNGTPSQTATYSDAGLFVYLVMANATAASLSGVAIFLSVWKKKNGNAKYAKVILPFLDAATPALLYLVTGAAFAAQDSMCVDVRDRAARGGTRKSSSQVQKSTIISLAAGIASSSADLIQKLQLSLSLTFGGGSDTESDFGCPTSCTQKCPHKH